MKSKFQKVEVGLHLCYCCGAEAQYSVELVNQDRRLYIPNQMVREMGHPCLMAIWFCRPCMRAIEDALRATVGYRIAEARQAVLDELEQSSRIPENTKGG